MIKESGVIKGTVAEWSSRYSSPIYIKKEDLKMGVDFIEFQHLSIVNADNLILKAVEK